MRALFLSQNHSVGIGLRQSHFNQFELNPSTPFSFLEARVEDYLEARGRPQEILANIRKQYPLALHGSSLNVGSAEGVNTIYLSQLRDLIDQFEPFVVSDHLSWVGNSHQYFHQHLPLPFTLESLNKVSSNIDLVQNFLKRPILIENVASYLLFNQNDMSEWEFFKELSARTGCFLLLDLCAIHINAHNQEEDILKILGQIPLERVAQVHLSGPTDYGFFLLDHREKNIPPQVWQLLTMIASKLRHIPITIENENTDENLSELKNQVRKAFNIIEASYDIKSTAATFF
jgi:uncharacterized protein (UPF0276 family)